LSQLVSWLTRSPPAPAVPAASSKVSKKHASARGLAHACRPATDLRLVEVVREQATLETEWQRLQVLAPIALAVSPSGRDAIRFLVEEHDIAWNRARAAISMAMKNHTDAAVQVRQESKS
jgi:hypothetical protein